MSDVQSGLSLSLLDSGNFVATCPAPLDPASEAPVGDPSAAATVLPVSTLSELSVATGLPSSDIQTWAASLPAGSMVRVTHHMDVKRASLAVAATAAALGGGGSAAGHIRNPPNPMDYIRHLPQHPTDVCNLDGRVPTSPVSCLPAFGEPFAFAVDPNAVLKRESFSMAVQVKDEPAESGIKSEPSSPLSSSTSSLASLVSQYSGETAVSDTGLAPDADGSNVYESFFDASLPPASVAVLPHFERPLPRNRQRNLANSETFVSSAVGEPAHMEELPMPGSAVVDFHHAMEEDVDLPGFQLNEQDLNSIKSIVEQTFRDGRDMLDIIEAV